MFLYLIARFCEWVRIGVTPDPQREREARAVVPEQTREHLHVHAVLKRQRCERVPEVVEPHLRRPCPLEDDEVIARQLNGVIKVLDQKTILARFKDGTEVMQQVEKSKPTSGQEE